MNANYNYPGIQAGSLWRLGNASLFITGNGSSNPLDNPQFKKAFDSAKSIAVHYFNDKDPEQFQKDFLERYTECVKKHDPMIIERFVKNVQGMSSLLIETGKKDNSYDFIIKEAKNFSKNIVSIFSTEDILEYFMKHIELYIDPFMLICYELLTSSKEVKKDFERYHQEKEQAWNLGVVYPPIEIPVFSDETIQALNNRALKDHHYTKDDLEKKGDKKMELFYEAQIKSGKTLIERISSLVETQENILILEDECNLEELFDMLREKKIEPIGPIREEIKPRGFLFEIKKVDTVVGYFLGSLHYTPRRILENFNSKILEAFEFCDVLGVEIDPTREDIINTREKNVEEKKFKTPNEWILKCKEFIAIGLKDIEAELEENDEDEVYIDRGLSLISKGLLNKYGIELGIDFAFIEKAKQRKMMIVDLESLETHMAYEPVMMQDMLNDFGKKNLDTPQEVYSEMKKQYQEMGERFPLIYETGYITALDAEAQGSKEHKEAMFRRNMEMVLKTDQLIRSGKKPFSIAGACHFAGGDMSMLKLTRNLGYTVTQVFCEETIGL